MPNQHGHYFEKPADSAPRPLAPITEPQPPPPPKELFLFVCDTDDPTGWAKQAAYYNIAGMTPAAPAWHRATADDVRRFGFLPEFIAPAEGSDAHWLAVLARMVDKLSTGDRRTFFSFCRERYGAE